MVHLQNAKCVLTMVVATMSGASCPSGLYKHVILPGNMHGPGA